MDDIRKLFEKWVRITFACIWDIIMKNLFKNLLLTLSSNDHEAATEFVLPSIMDFVLVSLKQCFIFKSHPTMATHVLLLTTIHLFLLTLVLLLVSSCVTFQVTTCFSPKFEAN